MEHNIDLKENIRALLLNNKQIKYDEDLNMLGNFEKEIVDLCEKHTFIYQNYLKYIMQCKDCKEELEEGDTEGLAFGCVNCTGVCDRCNELKYYDKIHPINSHENLCVPCFEKDKAADYDD